MRDDKLRDLEVLTIGSDPIDKTSKAADKEKGADAPRGARQCSLVATMVTAGAAKATKVKGTAVAAEQKAAAIAAATEDRAECPQQTKTPLEMRAVQQDRKKISEKAEDKVERLRKCLEQSVW